MTKFAIIGAGGIANAYAAAFKETEAARARAVADIRLDNAEALTKFMNHGSKAYADYREMLDAEPDIDAVLICTPPNSHPAIAKDVLARGIHVLCEKPLSIRSEEAVEMAEAAQNNGKLLTMASKFRCVEDVSKAKKLIDAGEIGDVILFENAFTSYVDMSQRWNANPEISGGGVLIDNGTHSLDIARFFLGQLAEIEVVEGRRTQGLPVDETVNVFARSTSGVLANIDLSWTINKSLDYYIRIFGSKGEIHVGWRESKMRLSGGDWVVFGTGYDKVAAFRKQIENFAAAINGQEPLLITAEDGIASVQAVEAAYRSLNHSSFHPVSMPPKLEIAA